MVLSCERGEADRTRTEHHMEIVHWWARGRPHRPSPHRILRVVRPLVVISVVPVFSCVRNVNSTAALRAKRQVASGTRLSQRGGRAAGQILSPTPTKVEKKVLRQIGGEVTRLSWRKCQKVARAGAVLRRAPESDGLWLITLPCSLALVWVKEASNSPRGEDLRAA